MPGVADILTLGVAPDRARVHCILVHGRGQTPEEMEAAVIARLSATDVAWHLPCAEGKSWYAARAIDPLTDATRADLGRSLTGLAQTVAAARKTATGRPLVLAGFSQGACLSLEHAFTGSFAPDAVVAFTGCRVGVPPDTRPAALPRDLPVYLSAGDADPWIPVAAFADAVAALGQGGARLRADVFPGRPHEVSTAEIAILDGILADFSAGRPPRMETAR
jgi:phospholipase/carboxylesterase